MKKTFATLILIVMIMIKFSNSLGVTYADLTSIVYEIYNEENELISERENVEIGDKIIDINFNEYEIYLKDETKQLAKAKFIQTYQKPNISKQSESISSKSIKKIAMYMTHNDESYIKGDGTESVYGAGGIHDIAKTLKTSLNQHGVEVELDETLHIPHNSSAYSRSAVTAKKLMKQMPDAIFDIHRDGANRQYYITSYEGKERSKIRIVLGQSNVNSKANLKFALYLLSVAEVECPWLFKDIYWGKGHYNQELSNKALLFEMGTHTIEKKFVQESAKELANVINKTLYDTTVDENDDLTIGGNEEGTNTPTVNEKLDEMSSSNKTLLYVLLPLLVGGMALGGSIAYYFFQKKKQKRKRK